MIELGEDRVADVVDFACSRLTTGPIPRWEVRIGQAGTSAAWICRRRPVATSLAASAKTERRYWAIRLITSSKPAAVASKLVNAPTLFIKVGTRRITLRSSQAPRRCKTFGLERLPAAKGKRPLSLKTV